ncbi:glycosyltransferase family 9 protein [Noviherbaspirillum massiliense]|uniref:glycosyltransferase family 9 protein n=1 Tax=Noviherbaspirillum massiliense TaxID=1465823 RepID=UPI0002E6B037|nr:glycosyltransferase family 9 protein [Noviherbaspirillum massiliense]
MSDPRWNQARNLLCIRLDQLGDVLMCTPAMRALKQAVPGRRITLMSSGSGGAVARFVPEVDELIEYASPWMKISRPHDLSVDLAMVETLRARGFDAAVIFTTYSQSPLPAALFCYLAGIPLRLAHCHENPYQLLSDWVPDPEPQQRVRHEVQRQLDLVATVGAHADDDRLSFRVPAEDMAWMRRQLQELGIGEGTRWIVLHPGATAASRRYPPRQWREVAKELERRFGCPLVFTGDAGEAALVDEIRTGLNHACSFAGRLDLGRLAALIKLAPLMISNNTGPAHMAAALGTPLVDLYALTNPQHTPWRVPNRVLYQDVPCRYCYKSVCPQGHHHCLTQVAPVRVADAAEALLQAQPEGHRDTLVLPF